MEEDTLLLSTAFLDRDYRQMGKERVDAPHRALQTLLLNFSTDRVI